MEPDEQNDTEKDSGIACSDSNDCEEAMTLTEQGPAGEFLLRSFSLTVKEKNNGNERWV